MSEQNQNPLTYKDIADTLSPSQSNEYASNGDRYSKAYANAMRALQERIKALESENAYLKDKISSIEGKGNSDREKWQQRLMEEVKNSGQKEKQYQNTIIDLEQEIKNLTERMMVGEEQMKIKDDQILYQINQGKTNYEQFILDRDNLCLEIEHLKNQLAAKMNEHQSSSNFVLGLERDKKLTEEENSQLRRINATLEEEVAFLRESTHQQKSSLQKSYQDFENEVNLKASEFLQTIKELEIKNKGLNEIATNQKKQIEYLKKEINDLHDYKKASLTQKIESLSSSSSRKQLSPSIEESKARRPKKSLSIKANENHVQKSRSPICETCCRRESSKTPKSSLKKPIPQKSFSKSVKINDPAPTTEEDIFSSIQSLEKEISSLGQKYKHLLQTSQEGTSDLSALRKEITETSSEIQQKSDALYELKKKHHSILREKLST
ncbi:unnamed protein product [Blepharisma stoltei]|uniref:Uncharacterized protein n=1 Tax=Blepharisma stoltei TaxID=1481888 RepID=A0AAU9I838_9CILI|nr:unnamed protein product [Blepharisma stoltei]